MVPKKGGTPTPGVHLSLDMSLDYSNKIIRIQNRSNYPILHTNVDFLSKVHFLKVELYLRILNYQLTCTNKVYDNATPDCYYHYFCLHNRSSEREREF